MRTSRQCSHCFATRSGAKVCIRILYPIQIFHLLYFWLDISPLKNEILIDITERMFYNDECKQGDNIPYCPLLSFANQDLYIRINISL